ncbi:hypothetical protein Hanom_Chr15g01373041 [Helianthus anomalus]
MLLRLNIHSEKITNCEVTHSLQSAALWKLDGNDMRPMETWVRSLRQTGFISNFIVVITGGWVTRFSTELVVDLGYSRNTPFGPVDTHKVFGIDSVGRPK